MPDLRELVGAALIEAGCKAIDVTHSTYRSHFGTDNVCFGASTSTVHFKNASFAIIDGSAVRVHRNAISEPGDVEAVAGEYSGYGRLMAIVRAAVEHGKPTVFTDIADPDLIEKIVESMV